MTNKAHTVFLFSEVPPRYIYGPSMSACNSESASTTAERLIEPWLRGKFSWMKYCFFCRYNEKSTTSFPKVFGMLHWTWWAYEMCFSDGRFQLKSASTNRDSILNEKKFSRQRSHLRQSRKCLRSRSSHSLEYGTFQSLLNGQKQTLEY